MINLVNILKHCPEGTKLYSPIFGEVTLYSVNNKIIDVIATKYNDETTHIEFSRLGRLILGYSNAECVLFPSKDQRDWSKFQIPAKRGDIMMFIDKSAVFIINTKKDNYTDTIAYVSNNTGFKIGEHIVRSYIPASEDMKEKFFTAIDKAGYKWDGETLKKKPQFKPFDKVLIKDEELDKWRCTFYSHFEPSGIYHHITTSGAYKMCIPFEGNEHLVGTTKNP